MGPLRFDPILKRLRWGGRRLGSVLNKPIGAGADYAESWEVCDHHDDQSRVADGPLRGWTLRRLVRERAPELLGRQAGLDGFPLLFKFLDASDRLSVQVHPNDEQANARRPGERGKTEAWVILDAPPGSFVYAGLKPQVTRETLAQAIAGGTVEECLHRLPVTRGDCVFIPAGTVHAIGEGVLLAEVQQTSNLTYRLFDWNRQGPDGKSRELHIDDSLACTDFDRGPVDLIKPRTRWSGAGHRVEQLVRCPYFQLVRHIVTEPTELPADDRCHVLMGLEGDVRVGDGHRLACGSTLLVPATALPTSIDPLSPSAFLEVFWD